MEESSIQKLVHQDSFPKKLQGKNKWEKYAGKKSRKENVSQKEGKRKF